MGGLGMTTQALEGFGAGWESKRRAVETNFKNRNLDGVKKYVLS
jgi:hypothetical protein